MKFSNAYIILIVMSLFFGSVAFSADSRDGSNNVVEIRVKNSAFDIQGGVIKTDRAATIILHNDDKITHGFTSSYFSEIDAKIQSEGVTTLGRGIKAIHVDSGKTVWIQFFPNHPGKFSFQCDLHPEMKGELLVLSIESI